MIIPNPFKPTAGKNPPMLIGRDGVINDFIEAIDNGSGAPGRLARVSGMRGTGKTVLLNELGRIAADRGWRVVEETASPGFCGRILESLTPRARVRSLKAEPSVLGFSLGGIEVERASLSLREAMAKTLESCKGGLLITLDEVQDASLEETRALAVAVQHIIRADADIAFVFAGLPAMVDEIINGEALTFLRRAEPVELGLVDVGEVTRSFKDTVEASGLRLEDDSARAMARATCGHPFMVQLVGYHSWQSAYRRDGAGGLIGEGDVEVGVNEARRRFDSIVLEPIVRHLPGEARAYVDAMAQLDGDAVRTASVAECMGRPLSSTSAVRAKLVSAGVIEPFGRGLVRFTTPFMAEYLREHADG